MPPGPATIVPRLWLRAQLRAELALRLRIEVAQDAQHPLAELAQLLRRDRLAEPLLDGIEKLRLQHDQQLPLRIRRAFESEDVAQTEEPRRKILQKRSEEHTSELQSREKLVCRLLLEK